MYNNNFQGKQLNNHELYRQFYYCIDKVDITFILVKGHTPSSSKNHTDRIFSLVDRASRNALRAYSTDYNLKWTYGKIQDMTTISTVLWSHSAKTVVGIFMQCVLINKQWSFYAWRPHINQVVCRSLWDKQKEQLTWTVISSLLFELKAKKQ